MNLEQPLPKILPSTEADLPAIAALAGIIWRTYYPGIISMEQIEYMLGKMYSLEVLRDEVRSCSIRYERLFVGEDFAGYASYGPTDQSEVFKLHKLYVHPSWHGRGLGSLLLRHCELEARKQGAGCLMLTVNKRNTTAIAAYQKNGFTIGESVVVEIGEGFVMDDYMMAKRLTL